MHGRAKRRHKHANEKEYEETRDKRPVFAYWIVRPLAYASCSCGTTIVAQLHKWAGRIPVFGAHQNMFEESRHRIEMVAAKIPETEKRKLVFENQALIKEGIHHSHHNC